PRKSRERDRDGEVKRERRVTRLEELRRPASFGPLLMSARPLWRSAAPLAALPALLMGAAPRGEAGLPEPMAGAVISVEEAAIEAQPVCIASTVRSAGELGPALLYRRARLPDGRIAVGYYAFFSEERPWGNNWMTWTLIPALAVD